MYTKIEKELKKMDNTYPFKLKPLPYDYNALEPFIDEKTMHLHHDKHLATYVTNLNNAIAKYPDYYNWPLEKLLYNINSIHYEIRTAVRNNGGGVFNHNLYFASMKPNGAPLKDGPLMHAINKNFENFEGFKKDFIAAALAVFGSGYTWLVSDSVGNVSIINTPNQDTVIPNNLTPVILIDCWEHAYYLKHYNVRADYITDWFDVANFDEAEKNYAMHGKVDYNSM